MNPIPTRRSIAGLVFVLIVLALALAPSPVSACAGNPPELGARNGTAAAKDPSREHLSRSREGIPEPALAEPALPELTAFAAQIEKIRALTFSKPVSSGRQSLAEFRGFVAKDLDLDLPPARAGCLSRALARLRLLPEGFDLRKAILDLLVTQVAAYYDPYRKTFFLVHPDLPEALLEPTIVHEMTHALQDQRFGLEARIRTLRGKSNDDAEAAFRFLVEGEATYVTTLSFLRGQGIDPDTNQSMVDTAIDSVSRLGRSELGAQIEQTKEIVGPELAKTLEQVLDYPEYLFRVLFDPYMAGQRAVRRIHRDEGWAAVNNLWNNPPESTEMLLHPEKLAGGRREAPVKVDVPDLSSALGAGYAPACENTLGEMGAEIMLEETLTRQGRRLDPSGARDSAVPPGRDGAREPAEVARRAEAAAAGWGGDRYRSFEKGGRETVVVWRTVWDTERDAREFSEALEAAGARPIAAAARPIAAAAAPAPAAGSPAASSVPTAGSTATPAPMAGSITGDPGADRPTRTSGAAGTRSGSAAAKESSRPAIAHASRVAKPTSGDEVTTMSPDSSVAAASPRSHVAAASPSSHVATASPRSSAVGASPSPATAAALFMSHRGLEVTLVAGATSAQARAAVNALDRSLSSSSAPVPSAATRSSPTGPPAPAASPRTKP